MSAVAFPLEHQRRRLRLRAAVAGAVGIGLLLGSLVGAVALRARSASGTTTVHTAMAAGGAGAEPTAAIQTWLVDNGARPDEYTGTCEHDGVVDALCSALQEDRGDVQIHTVGLYASDFGSDVLLERTASGWRVTAAAPWPDLGDPYLGPPWSPLTAISTWWAERAADTYGTAAPHLRSCDIVPTDELALCSTLVDDAGDVRVYDSGRAGGPPDVRITVVEQPDRTWAVTETLAA